MKKKISISLDATLVNKLDWDVKEHKANSLSERIETLVKFGQAMEKSIEAACRKD